jgi:hypothetical protein
MKKLLLLMLPLTAFTFIACDKGDDNGGNETITGKLVKTIHYDGHDDLFEFFYDDKQRIIKITETPIGEHLYGYSNNNRITWFINPIKTTVNPVVFFDRAGFLFYKIFLHFSKIIAIFTSKSNN